MNEKVLDWINRVNEVRVLDLIPENGKSIRFNELQGKCKEHSISYRILLKELKRLEAAGTIIKEFVKAERGAGTSYRRTVFIPIDRYITPTEAVLDFKDVMEDMVEGNPDKNEAEKWAAWGFYRAYATIFQAILNELELSRSYPEPEKRFDCVLNDFIVPLIKRLSLHYRHPAINNERAKSAIFEAIMLGYKEWDTVWKLSTVIDSHQKDDNTKKRR